MCFSESQSYIIAVLLSSTRSYALPEEFFKKSFYENI